MTGVQTCALPIYNLYVANDDGVPVGSVVFGVVMAFDCHVWYDRPVLYASLHFNDVDQKSISHGSARSVIILMWVLVDQKSGVETWLAVPVTYTNYLEFCSGLVSTGALFRSAMQRICWYICRAADSGDILTIRRDAIENAYPDMPNDESVTIVTASEVKVDDN